MSVGVGKKFCKSKDEQWFMRFRTKHPDGDNYDGIVVHVARAFAVLREVRDFDIDGVIVLPKSMIRGFRDGQFEACTNEILRHSKELRRLKTPSWLPRCGTLSDVLASLAKRSVWPGIEALCDDGSTAFYLGLIENISAERVSIRCYDAAGKWEKIYHLPMQEIFRIEFDSRYCNVFNRYMQSRSTESQEAKRRRG